MPRSSTLTGAPFEYSGSLTDGLTIRFKRGSLRIPPVAITFIREQITRRSPVAMGANRDPLVPDSVGKTLHDELGLSPQMMSYVTPLLVADGFCRASRRGRAFILDAR